MSVLKGKKELECSSLTDLSSLVYVSSGYGVVQLQQVYQVEAGILGPYSKNLFSLELMYGHNKAECLSLANLSSLV
jgi:hypothetical protein